MDSLAFNTDSDAALVDANGGSSQGVALSNLANDEMIYYSSIDEQRTSSEIKTEMNCSYNAIPPLARSSGLKRSAKKAKKLHFCPVVLALLGTIAIACIAGCLSVWALMEVRKFGSNMNVVLQQLDNCSCVNAEGTKGQEDTNSYLNADIFFLWSENVTHRISSLQNQITTLYVVSSFLHENLTSLSECGPGLWKSVISLNMTDSSQQCPSEWEQFSSPMRSCGRPNTVAGCNQVSLAVGTQYNKVCGRAVARIVISPDAFGVHGDRDSENYVDGVSVTHSSPRQHIWTFAADHNANFRCPCNGYKNIAPSFVGNSYFCDASANGALWDGEGCVSGLSCCTFNSPPWFSTQLPAPTSDDIDIRLCTDENTFNENVRVELIELYVQ